MGSEGGGWGGNWEEGSYGGGKKRNKCNNLNNKDLIKKKITERTKMAA